METQNEIKAKEFATTEDGKIISFAYIAAMRMALWKDEQLIDKVYEAYCKACGHFAHTTPIETRRQYCQRYEDFKQIIK